MFPASARKTLIEEYRLPVRSQRLRKFAREPAGEFGFRNESDFIQALQNEGIIRLTVLKSRNGKTIPMYCSRPLDEVSLYEMAAGMFPKGYFCNLSSVYFHSLTDQVPGVVYICNETITPRTRDDTRTLPESAIRTAFIKPHRHTRNIIDLENGAVAVLDRERGTDFGVTDIRAGHPLYPAGMRVTCLERALIDAVVAPQYNGGIASVLSYFRAAKRWVRVDRLFEIYGALRFVYPYAQTIGFLLERAGMPGRAAAIREAYPPRQKFFIDHEAKSTWAFDERWMLYHPRGLFDED